MKFADGLADSGPVAELAALRRELGEAVRNGVDLHWRHQPAEAIRVIREMEPYDPWFAEAPVAPEDVAAQAEVAHSVRTPMALGEECRTVHDVKLRFEHGCPAIVQPEMGHTGPTEFLRIAALAHAEGITVMPHATIGAGILLAASLHAAAAIETVASHEFQHSILLRHHGLLDSSLECAGGANSLPPGPGLGVRPGAEVRRMDYRERFIDARSQSSQKSRTLIHAVNNPTAYCVAPTHSLTQSHA